MEVIYDLQKHYKNRSVLVTGHTGFKGSWLSLWLEMMGAHVVGYSLAPPTQPSHYEYIEFEHESVIDDILDYERFKEVVEREKPELIFHLAAQPLVRQSYSDPRQTMLTNIIGTANVIDAAMHAETTKGVVVITSDKCYKNKEWIWSYREDDRLGGHDPYSASKACAEFVVSSYRSSFLDGGQGNSTMLLASARAGNVIGGGDWADDRLVPDLVKAACQGTKTLIRNPDSVRPWQHVLESLSGYLVVGAGMLRNQSRTANAWNFGPDDTSVVNVLTIVTKMQRIWDRIYFECRHDSSRPHEASLLKLDSTKAKTFLQWKPIWDLDVTLRKTLEWYQAFYETKVIRSREQIQTYVEDARRAVVPWAL